MILVTGHMGFLGARVVLALEAAGKQWWGLDKRERNHGDLLSERTWCDPEVRRRLAATTAIIHCAAYADLRSNWEYGEANRVWRDCADSTRVLLDQLFQGKGAGDPPLQRFINVSSSAVTAEPLGLYGAAKLTSEFLVEVYAAKMGFKGANCRPCAMVGPGYHHGHLADFVRSAKKGCLTVEDAHASFPLMHVDDVAADLVRLGNGAPRQAYAGQWSTERSAEAILRRRKVEVRYLNGDRPFGYGGQAAYAWRKEADARVAQGVEEALDSLGWPAAEGVAQ